MSSCLPCVCGSDGASKNEVSQLRDELKKLLSDQEKQVNMAMKWCQRTGVSSVDDITQHNLEDNFMQALAPCLKLVEEKSLRTALACRAIASKNEVSQLRDELKELLSDQEKQVNMAMKWCQRTGVSSVDDITQHNLEDNFMQALAPCLKLVEEKSLQTALAWRAFGENFRSYLKTNGLLRLAGTLLRHGIRDVDELCQLTDEDMREMGMNMGDRLKLRSVVLSPIDNSPATEITVQAPDAFGRELQSPGASSKSRSAAKALERSRSPCQSKGSLSPTASTPTTPMPLDLLRSVSDKEHEPTYHDAGRKFRMKKGLLELFQKETSDFIRRNNSDADKILGIGVNLHTRSTSLSKKMRGEARAYIDLLMKTEKGKAAEDIHFFHLIPPRRLHGHLRLESTTSDMRCRCVMIKSKYEQIVRERFDALYLHVYAGRLVYFLHHPTGELIMGGGATITEKDREIVKATRAVGSLSKFCTGDEKEQLSMFIENMKKFEFNQGKLNVSIKYQTPQLQLIQGEPNPRHGNARKEWVVSLLKKKDDGKWVECAKVACCSKMREATTGLDATRNPPSYWSVPFHVKNDQAKLEFMKAFPGSEVDEIMNGSLEDARFMDYAADVEGLSMPTLTKPIQGRTSSQDRSVLEHCIKTVEDVRKFGILPEEWFEGDNPPNRDTCAEVLLRTLDTCDRCDYSVLVLIGTPNYPNVYGPRTKEKFGIDPIPVGSVRWPNQAQVWMGVDPTLENISADGRHPKLDPKYSVLNYHLPDKALKHWESDGAVVIDFNTGDVLAVTVEIKIGGMDALSTIGGMRAKTASSVCRLAPCVAILKKKKEKKENQNESSKDDAQEYDNAQSDPYTDVQKGWTYIYSSSDSFMGVGSQYTHIRYHPGIRGPTSRLNKLSEIEGDWRTMFPRKEIPEDLYRGSDLDRTRSVAYSKDISERDKSQDQN